VEEKPQKWGAWPPGPYLAPALVRAVLNSRPQSEVSAQCGHFADKGGGVFRSGRPHFLAQKSSDFLKFMVCPRGQGGLSLEPVRTFCGQAGEGQFFAILCGRLFWTAPNEISFTTNFKI